MVDCNRRAVTEPAIHVDQTVRNRYTVHVLQTRLCLGDLGLVPSRLQFWQSPTPTFFFSRFSYSIVGITTRSWSLSPFESQSWPQHDEGRWENSKGPRIATELSKGEGNAKGSERQGTYRRVPVTWPGCKSCLQNIRRNF